jgi:hypothetical protein
MSQYDIVQTMQTPIDLSNVSQCIPHDQFMAMLPDLVLKADAIKLGLICFAAGMIVKAIIDYIFERYFNGNS